MKKPHIPRPKKPEMTPVLIRVSNWLEQHPHTVKHIEYGCVAVITAFTVLNTGLFTLQNNRVPAFTSINGKDYSLMSIADTKRALVTEHEKVQINLKAGATSTTLNANDAGITVDVDKTLQAFTQKSGWERIPVISAIGNLFSDPKVVYTVDKEQLSSKLSSFVTTESVPATDAAAAIPSDINQPVTVTQELAGRELTALTAADEVADTVTSGKFSVIVTSKPLAPKWTKLDFTAFMPAIEAARHSSIAIESNDKRVVITGDTLNAMLRLDTTGAALKMTLDPGLVKTFLEGQAPQFYSAPIATKTTQRDGAEIGRTQGVAGKALDATATASQVVKAFESGVLSVTPATTQLTPDLLVSKTYSNTDTGLYKLMEDFAKTHTGKYSVAAVELNGVGTRSAFYNADASMITASTYKLFVAYGIMQRIEQGSMTMATSTESGTVGDCMYKMIHVSDNTCAATLQKLLGYSTFAAQMKADGFANTNLVNNTGDKHSTARDEMTLVTKLYNHELINTASTNYLFDLMKGQIFRSGIPAGSNGSVVADKVGFLYALNHDIGVVYSPKSTYALVILTDGAGGWNNVKLLAQQIYDFYNQ